MTALSLAPIGHHWPRERAMAFYREVASMLGISEGTSKSQVHKARLKLRRMLAGS